MTGTVDEAGWRYDESGFVQGTARNQFASIFWMDRMRFFNPFSAKSRFHLVFYRWSLPTAYRKQDLAVRNFGLL